MTTTMSTGVGRLGIAAPRAVPVVLLVGTAVLSCFGGGGGGGGGGSSTGITLRGTVLADNGVGLVGATLTWNGALPTTATNTDIQGAFSFSGTPAATDASVLLTTTAPGFAPQTTLVPLKQGVTTYTLHLVLTAVQSYPVDATQPTTVTFQLPGPGGVSHPTIVTVPAGMPAGTSARVAPIDVKNSPGNMRAEGGPMGDALASLGMFYLDFVDGTGNAVPAPAGVTVTLGAQAPPTIPSSDPGFSGWILNPDGNWDKPTPMTAPAASAPAPPAPVPQIGYWNCDHAFRTACIMGTVTSPSGVCGGALVDVTGTSGFYSFDTSGADGSFCLVGPQGGTGALNVAGGASVTFPTQPGNCFDPTFCAMIPMLSISDSECQNAGGMSDGGVSDGGAGDAGPCGPSGFMCADGTCIAASVVCNQVSDCPDGSDEDPNICGNPTNCCVATKDCPGETGSQCGTGCCCCPGGQACCADPNQGCCNSP